jgi:6-phosphofructokinase
VVADAVDSLRSTAEAHRRIMIVETMGRTAGWIALGGGLASYADAILIPERPFSKRALIDFVNLQKKSEKRGLVFVISESSHAENEAPEVSFQVANSFEKERFGGIAERLARWIETESVWEARHVVLGHLQRSRPPTTTDRFLTAAMGVKAAKLALEKKWFQAVVYREGSVKTAPLSDIQGGARRVSSDHRWVKTAQNLGLFI